MRGWGGCAACESEGGQAGLGDPRPRTGDIDAPSQPWTSACACFSSSPGSSTGPSAPRREPSVHPRAPRLDPSRAMPPPPRAPPPPRSPPSTPRPLFAAPLPPSAAPPRSAPPSAAPFSGPPPPPWPAPALLRPPLQAAPGIRKSGRANGYLRGGKGKCKRRLIEFNSIHSETCYRHVSNVLESRSERTPHAACVTQAPARHPVQGALCDSQHPRLAARRHVRAASDRARPALEPQLVAPVVGHHW